MKFLTISEWEFLDFYSYKKKLSYLNTFFTKKINELTEALNKEKQKPLSYLDKIKMKIIDNLHIKFKDIHIRIEDNSNKPFSSLGITLDELLIINTNDNWEESFINRHDNSNENYLYKLLKIHNFGFYLISGENIFVSQKENDDKGIKKEVMKQIKSNELVNRYLIKPICITAKMKQKVKNDNKEKSPKIELWINLENFDIDVKKEQFDTIVRILNFVSKYQRFQYFKQESQKFNYYKPQCPVKDNYSKWFRYAISTIIKKRKYYLGNPNIFKLNHFIEENYHKEFNRLLLLYFKNNQDETLFEENERKLFTRIVDIMDINVLYEWSIDSIENYFKEKKIQNLAKNEDEKEKTSTASFLNFFTKDNKEQKITLTVEEEEKIEEIIQNLKNEIKNDLLIAEKEEKLKLMFTLNVGSFYFSNHNQNFNVDYSNLNFSISKSDSIIDIEISLSTFSTQMITKYPNQTEKRVQITLNEENTSKDYIWKLQLKIQNVNNKTNFLFDLHIRSIDIIYHQELIERVISFFLVKKNQIDDDLANIAWETINDFKAKTKEQIENVISHKQNEINIRVDKRRIILPLNKYNVKQSKILLIDLGDLVIQNHRNEQDSEKYKCDLTSFNLLYLTSFDKCITKSYKTAFYLIKDLQCTIFITVLKDKSQYEKKAMYDVTIELNSITVNLNQELYYTMQFIIDAIKPTKQNDYWAILEENVMDIKKNCKSISRVNKIDNLDLSSQYKDYFAVISGGYIYFFNQVEDKDYESYFYIKNSKITIVKDETFEDNVDYLREKNGNYEININNKYGNINLQFSSKNKMETFNKALLERMNEMNMGNDKEDNNQLQNVSVSNNTSQALIKMISLTSTIKTLKINFYNDDNTVKEYTFDISDMKFDGMIRQYDIVFLFSLSSLHLYANEYKEANNQLYEMIKSPNNLIQITITIAKEQSPLYKNSIITINVQIGDILIQWNPNNIRKLLFFLVHNDILRSKIKDEMQSVPSQSQLNEKILNYYYTNTESKLKNSLTNITDDKKPSCLDNKSVLFCHISVTISSIEMMWLHPISLKNFAKISMKKSSLDAELTVDDYHIFGVLNAMKLCDMTNYPYEEDGKEYEILSATLSFDYFLMSLSCPLMKDNYTSKCNLIFSSVKLNYYHEYFFRGFNYVFDEFLNCLSTPLEIKTFKNIKNSISNIKTYENFEFIGVKVEFKNPQVLIRERKNAQNYFVVDLGNITIRNEYKGVEGKIKSKPKEKRYISIYYFMIENIFLGREDNRKILQNCDAQLKLELPVFFNGEENEYNENEIDKSLSIDLSFTKDISFNFYQKDFTIIMKCVDLNFLYQDGKEDFYNYKQFHIKKEDKPIQNKTESIIDINLIQISFTLKIPNLSLSFYDNLNYNKICNFDIVNINLILHKRHTGPNQLNLTFQSICGYTNKKVIFLSNNLINVKESPNQFQIKFVMDKNGDKNIIIYISNIKFIFHYDIVLLLKTFFFEGLPQYDPSSIDIPNKYDPDIDNKPNMRINFEINNILLCFLTSKKNDQNILCISTNLAVLYKKAKLIQSKRELVNNYNMYTWKMSNTTNQKEIDALKTEMTLDYKESSNLVINFNEISPYISSFKDLLNNSIPKRRLTNNFAFSFNMIEQLKFNHPSSFISLSSSMLTIEDIICKLSYRDLVLIVNSIHFNTSLNHLTSSAISSFKRQDTFILPETKVNEQKRTVIDKGMRLDKIIVKTAKIILIDDHADTYYPFLSLVLKEIDITREMLSHTQSSLILLFDAKVIVYNYYIGIWEPIIERSNVRIERVRDEEDKTGINDTWEVKIGCEDIEYNRENKVLNINISDTAISFLYTTLFTWIDKYKKYSKEKEIKEDNIGKGISNHSVVNLSGREMKLYLARLNEKNNEREVCYKEITKIELNGKYDIEYSENSDEFYLYTNSTNKKDNLISISFEDIGYEKISHNFINIDQTKIKKHIADYQKVKEKYKTSNELKQYEYIYSEVKIIQMKKVITISSPLVFVNDLKETIKVRLNKKKYSSSFHISPNEKWGIPYEYFDGNIEFRFMEDDQPQIFDIRIFLENSYSNSIMRFDDRHICFYNKSDNKNIITIAVSSPYKIKNLLPFTVNLTIKQRQLQLNKNDTLHIDHISSKDELICDEISCLEYKSITKTNLFALSSFTLYSTVQPKAELIIQIANKTNRRMISNNNTIYIYSTALFHNATTIPFTLYSTISESNIATFTNEINLLPLSSISHIQVEIKTDGLKYLSGAIALNSIGLLTNVSCSSYLSSTKYEFNLSSSLISLCDDINLYATMFTMHPKYVVVNKTEYPIHLALKDKLIPVEIYRKQSYPLCCNELIFKMRLIENENEFKSGSKWNWSRELKMDVINNATIQIRGLVEKNNDKTYLNIEKKIGNFSTYIIIEKANESNAQFVIKNKSQYINVKIYQSDFDEGYELVIAKKSRIFSWSNVGDDIKVRKLKVEFLYRDDKKNGLMCCKDKYTKEFIFYQRNIEDKEKSQNTNNSNSLTYNTAEGIFFEGKERTYPFHEIITIYKDKQSGYKIHLEITTDGIKRIITVSDYFSKDSYIKSSSPSYITELNLKIYQIGLSIIATSKKTIRKRNEICYASLKEIQFYYKRETTDMSVYDIQCKIHYIQIDNMASYITQFPIILRPENIPNKSVPFFNISASFYKYGNQTNEPLKFNYFTYLIQSFALSLDSEILEEFIYFINNIVKRMHSGNNQVYFLLNGNNDKETYIKPYWMNTSNISSVSGDKDKTKFFFSTIKASSIEMILSLRAGDVLEKMFTSNAIFGTFLSTMSNMEKADLMLNGCLMINLYISYDNLITLILNKYKQSILTEVLTIVGAIDVLGNPSNLFKSLGTGVKEFFTKPIEGIVRGPLDGVEGAIEGGYSLIKHTIGGTFTATSKIATGISKGLLHLSSNDSYMRKIEKEKLTLKPKNFVYGLGYGITSFTNGIFNGIKDVIVKPIEETQKNGIIGIGTGLFKGIGGLFSKPVVGVLQMVSTTSEGIKNTFTEDQGNIKQERMQRPFYGKYKYIKSYNSFHAYVIWFIKTNVEDQECKHIDFCDVEYYINVKGEGTFLLFSTQEFFFIDETRKLIKNKIPYNYVKEALFIPNKQVVRLILNDMCKEVKTAEIYLNHSSDNGDIIAKKMQKAIKENVDNLK